MVILIVVIILASLVFFLPFILTLIEIIRKNYQNYKSFSSLKGFHPNPSYLIGHAALLTIALKINLRGFEAGKAVSSAARTAPFKDCGFMAGWLGNIIYGLPVIVPTRVEVLKQVLGSKQFVHKSSLYYIAKIAFGRGLLCSSRGTWQRHRKLLNPTFHQHLLQRYAPIMSKQSIKLVEGIKTTIQSGDAKIEKDGKRYLIDDFTHRLSGRIMAMLLETIMGVKEGDLDENFMKLAEEFDSVMCCRLTKPWNLIKPIYKLTKEGRELIHAMDFGHSEVKRIISKRINDYKFNETTNTKDAEAKDENRKPTLIDSLIEEHKLNPQNMPIDDIIDEVMNFLLAGWDTTTWSVSMILQVIGLHPTVQEKMYQEIVQQLFINGSPPTAKTELTMKEMKKLKFMECVIFEVLRLYPLINVHGRRLAEELTCTIDGDKVTFPAGTEVVIDSELVHTSPLYWKDPNRFHPERFMGSTRERTQNEKENFDENANFEENNENISDNFEGSSFNNVIEPFSFIPFSAGPRNCIGKAYGLLEIKIILTQLLINFKISSKVEMDKIKYNFVGTVRRTKEPIELIFEPRNGGKICNITSGVVSKEEENETTKIGAKNMFEMRFDEKFG